MTWIRRNRPLAALLLCLGLTVLSCGAGSASQAATDGGELRGWPDTLPPTTLTPTTTENAPETTASVEQAKDTNLAEKQAGEEPKALPFEDPEQDEPGVPAEDSGASIGEVLEDPLAEPTGSSTPPRPVATEPPANDDDRNLPTPSPLTYTFNPTETGWQVGSDIDLPTECGPSVAFNTASTRLQVGEVLDLTIVGESDHGVHTIWFWSDNAASVLGWHTVTEGWTRYGATWPISFDEPGRHEISAQMRDLAYWSSTDDLAHQASEGCGSESILVIVE